jgi:hypothetical protein
MLGSARSYSTRLLTPARSAYTSSGGGVRGFAAAAGTVKRPMMVGGGLFAGASVVGSRRTGGLDKTVGRPTGMYQY